LNEIEAALAEVARESPNLSQESSAEENVRVNSFKAWIQNNFNVFMVDKTKGYSGKIST